MEEQGPMVGDKKIYPTKHEATQAVVEEEDNVEALENKDEVEVFEQILEGKDEEKEEVQKPVLHKATKLPKQREKVLVKQNSKSHCNRRLSIRCRAANKYGTRRC